MEQMTVFLVAQPSVVLQQLAEGSAAALDPCLCGGGWCWLAWQQGGSGRRGGCVYAGELERFKKICLGGEEGAWL